MIRFATYGLISFAVALFAVSGAFAQSCQFNGNCTFPQTCQPGLFGGFCAIQACNADTDCRNGSACALGLCRALCTGSNQCSTGEACVRLEGRRVCVAQQPSSGGGSGTTPVYTAGGRCGVIRYGQVTKRVGCAPGLRCTNPNGSGICVRLAS